MKYKCNNCGHVFEGGVYTTQCPKCGHYDIADIDSVGDQEPPRPPKIDILKWLREHKRILLVIAAVVLLVVLALVLMKNCGKKENPPDEKAINITVSIKDKNLVFDVDDKNISLVMEISDGFDAVQDVFVGGEYSYALSKIDDNECYSFCLTGIDSVDVNWVVDIDDPTIIVTRDEDEKHTIKCCRHDSLPSLKIEVDKRIDSNDSSKYEIMLTVKEGMAEEYYLLNEKKDTLQIKSEASFIVDARNESYYVSAKSQKEGDAFQAIEVLCLPMPKNVDKTEIEKNIKNVLDGLSKQEIKVDYAIKQITNGRKAENVRFKSENYDKLLPFLNYLYRKGKKESLKYEIVSIEIDSDGLVKALEVKRK